MLVHRTIIITASSYIPCDCTGFTANRSGNRNGSRTSLRAIARADCSCTAHIKDFRTRRLRAPPTYACTACVSHVTKIPFQAGGGMHRVWWSGKSTETRYSCKFDHPSAIVVLGELTSPKLCDFLGPWRLLEEFLSWSLPLLSASVSHIIC